MNNFDYKAYLKNNYLLQENEGDDLIVDVGELGNELASAIGAELKQKEDQLNEAVTLVGTLGWILLSNTIVHMISKFAKKQFAKSGNLKGEEWAEWFEKNSHTIENLFKSPITAVLSIYIQDETWVKRITDVLYAIAIFAMAGSAGGAAVSYVKKASYFKGAVYTLKSLVKGVEVKGILGDVISDMLS